MDEQQTAQSMAMQAYYTQARQAARQLLVAYQTLQALQLQWNSLDYGNTLEPGDGVHSGLERGDIGAVVFATADAVGGLMAQGHGTNIAGVL
jgi:hypothetical protein